MFRKEREVFQRNVTKIHNKAVYQETIECQRKFFYSGETLSAAFRKLQLKKLHAAIIEYTPRIEAAIYSDFRKSSFEVYLSEIAMSLRSVTQAIKNVETWSRPKRVKSDLLNFPSTDYIIPEPLGVTLIISPWNYPFLLAIDPLIAAISAGNCVVIKPSELTSATSAVIQEMLGKTFDRKYIAVIQGDAVTTEQLLSNRFDKIFFTGSTNVGRIVYQAASKHLTPVTLELGGKSPCIVTESANLAIAAKRIIWGKMLNAGQTCVAPDYVIVDEKIKEPFIVELKKVIVSFYGSNIKENPDFPRIINSNHFKRLKKFLSNGHLVVGGETDEEQLYISPTILDQIAWEDEIMQEEIFGPILPILTYRSLTEILEKINSAEKPLALYIFSNNRKEIRHIETSCHFGGGCVNDTISHLLSHRLPFGGVGNSGIGSYHGKFGFDTFSHFKSMVTRKTWIDIPLRYAPYSEGRLKFFRKYFK